MSDPTKAHCSKCGSQSCNCGDIGANAPERNRSDTLTLSNIRKHWKAHGGKWHGPRIEHWSIPRVEHWSIPEDNVVDFASDLYTAQAAEIAALQAKVEALTVELDHCVYELERENSRQPHRRRRATLARAALSQEGE